MTVTALSRTKRGRFAMSVDGEYIASLDELTVMEYHIYEGCTLDEATLNTVLEVARHRRATEKAINLIGYRDHSKKELTDKLKRTNSEEAAISAVHRLEELGMVDDASYARRLAADLFNLKHYAESRVRFELNRRGISDDLIEEAVESAPDPREKIAELLSGKLRNILRDKKGRQKIINRLNSLGYRWEDIKAALANEQWNEDDEFYGE